MTRSRMGAAAAPSMPCFAQPSSRDSHAAPISSVPRPPAERSSATMLQPSVHQRSGNTSLGAHPVELDFVLLSIRLLYRAVTSPGSISRPPANSTALRTSGADGGSRPGTPQFHSTRSGACCAAKLPDELRLNRRPKQMQQAAAPRGPDRLSPSASSQRVPHQVQGLLRARARDVQQPSPAPDDPCRTSAISM